MDDDDMFLNDDDFDDDTKMSKLDEAKIKIANYMVTNLQSLNDSLQYNERANARTKLDIVTEAYYELLELFKLDDKSDLSEEEMSTIIKKIDASTKVMTMENQDDILKELKDDDSETFTSNSTDLSSGIFTIHNGKLTKVDNPEDITAALDELKNKSEDADDKTSKQKNSSPKDKKPNNSGSDDTNNETNIDW